MHPFPLAEVELLKTGIGDDVGLLAKNNGGGLHCPGERAGKDGVHLQGIDPIPQKGGLASAMS